MQSIKDLLSMEKNDFFSPKHPNLAKVSTWSTILLLCVIPLFLSGVWGAISTLSKEWDQSSNNILRKEDVLHNIKSSLGYTGFIHNFKNYVIRRDEFYFNEATKKISLAMSLIQEYKALKISQDENYHLGVVASTISQYKEKLNLLKHEEAVTLGTKELDRIVKVDDTEARLALASLSSLISNDYRKVQKTTQQQLQQAKWQMILFLTCSLIALISYALLINISVRDSKRSTRNLKRLLQVLPDGLLVIDSDGTIVVASDQALKIFGYQSDELLGREVEYLISGGKKLEHIAWRESFMRKPEKREMGADNSKVKGLHKSGRHIPLTIAISQMEVAEEKYGVALVKDKTQEARLIELSETDQLTSVYNRRSIDKVLDREIERAVRYKHDLSFVLLDIDDFKGINDGDGHQAGDAMLTALATILKSNSRPSDIVGRWGGDEFCIICPETKAPDAESLIGVLGILPPNIAIRPASHGWRDL